MAAYGWIYANAKIRGDGGDYLVRHCSPGLEKYKGMLRYRMDGDELAAQLILPLGRQDPSAGA